MRTAVILACLLILVVTVTSGQADKKDRKPEAKTTDAVAADQGLRVTILRVQTRTRFSFKYEVTQALNGVKGVKSYVVRADDNRISVRFDPAICKREDIVQALERVGFPVVVLR